MMGRRVRITTHAKKVNEADLQYPIDLYFNQNKWILLDGVHRLAKAVKLGHKKIKVRKVSPVMIKKIKISSRPLAEAD